VGHAERYLEIIVPQNSIPEEKLFDNLKPSAGQLRAESDLGTNIPEMEEAGGEAVLDDPIALLDYISRAQERVVKHVASLWNAHREAQKF
jgi:hypothetical protein